MWQEFTAVTEETCRMARALLSVIQRQTLGMRGWRPRTARQKRRGTSSRAQAQKGAWQRGERVLPGGTVVMQGLSGRRDRRETWKNRGIQLLRPQRKGVPGPGTRRARRGPRERIRGPASGKLCPRAASRGRALLVTVEMRLTEAVKTLCRVM